LIALRTAAGVYEITPGLTGWVQVNGRDELPIPIKVQLDQEGTCHEIGVKANFQAKMRWLSRGLPLPLAALTNNRRSLVALDNLIDLIITCLNHPAAANQTFLVSDAEDLSTADLFKRSGAALGRHARLLYLPTSLLKLVAAMLNKSAVYQRLSTSLQVDISKTRELLGWTPPISVDEGLRRAAKAFLQ